MGAVAGFTVTAEVLAAYAFYQGVDVSAVSDADVRTYAMAKVQQLVQTYRTSVRDAANPVDTTEALS
jgi:enoyl-[acyl-carrier-protein] reductase (NADH)